MGKGLGPECDLKTYRIKGKIYVPKLSDFYTSCGMHTHTKM